MAYQCHKCGAEIEIIERVFFRAECEQCGVYLHCCLNCVFYDPHAPNQCKSPTIEWVSDKEKMNFCVEFEFVSTAHPDIAEQDNSRKDWDDLFK